MKLTHLSVAVLMLLAGAAQARNPAVIRLADGLNAGPTGDNTGPGAEQATLVQSIVDGHHYITTVWMSSQVSTDDAPYQCKCATTELDATGGPRIVAGPTQITALNGDRPCNHPHMDINPVTNQILLSYATTDHPNANNNVQPVVQGMTNMCQTTTNRLVLGNNNGNDGAPWVQVVDGPSGLFQVGYLENNQRSRAVGISLPADATNLTSTDRDNNNHPLGGNILYNKTIVDPANIGRPSIARLSATNTIFCSSNGNNRPPEIGVACANVDALTGNKLWIQVIAASHPGGNGNCTNQGPDVFCMNQPIVALGDNGRFYLQVEKTAGPAGNDRRGATTTMLYTMSPDDTGPHVGNNFESIGLNQVHATTCTGKFGQDGKVHLAVADSSITGSGFAATQMARFDVLGGNIQLVNSAGDPTVAASVQVLGAHNGDGGYLANIDGQNPNTQGRDFMRCIGDIPNPGFGVTGGFLPSVKSFFAFPFAGCSNDNGHNCDPDQTPVEKNSLFLSLLPAEEPAPPPIVNHDLHVTVSGEGIGKVFSSPLGVDGCDITTSPCSATYEEGTNITLTAQAGVGSVFEGWSGDCTGTGGCVLSMGGGGGGGGTGGGTGGDRNVTAVFSIGDVIVNDPVGLVVNVGGDGTGNVTSDPAGITCDTGTCFANFDRNTSVTLTATPAQGSKFGGWTGDCASATTESTCVLTLAAAKNASVTFAIDPDAPPPDDATPGGKTGGVGARAGCGCSESDSSGAAPALAAMFLFAGVVAFRRRRSALASAVVGAAVVVVGASALTACAAPEAPPVIDAFVAVTPTVAPNTPVELAFQVRDAEGITITQLGQGDILPLSTLLNGSIYSPPLTNSTTFILTANGPALAGRQPASVTSSVSVLVAEPTAEEPAPEGVHASIVAFGAETTNVTTGGSTTLTWATNGASSGVILANDAVLQVVAADSIASGTVDVTPSASTVYTLEVNGADGQQLTKTTAVNVSPPGVGPLTAQNMFDANVKSILQAKCAACHQSANPSGYPDLLGSGPDAYYARITADARFIPAVPEDSLLLVKGEHTGPAFLPAEAQTVTAWLVAEASERFSGGTPPVTPTGDFAPANLSEALTRFGACMDRQVWDTTYGASNNTMIARQGTTQGQCTACHSSGTAGAFLSTSSGDTFDMARLRPYVLKLVLSTANDDGSFKDLVPARRFELKGSEGGDHPSYVMAQERIDAINSFVDQTLTRFHDFSQSCQ